MLALVACRPDTPDAVKKTDTAVLPRSGPAAEQNAGADRSWAEFLAEPDYADLHNDRSFFLTARKVAWQDCSRVQFCAANYRRSNSFFSLWRPPRPIGAGPPWGLSPEQAARLNGMTHFEYLRTAIADLKAAGLTISDDPDLIGRSKSHVFLGIEGAYLLNNRDRGQPNASELKEILNLLQKEKVSYVALVWSNNNVYAGTSRQPGKGLTEKGRMLVRLLTEAGMLIDLSHASDKTVLDLHAFTGGRTPLFFSHSSARGLCNDPRNLSDRLLKLVRSTGGLVGVNFYTKYLTCSKKADIDAVADHIAYIRRITGPEHVALGSDFDGLISLPDGLKKPEQLGQLARLLERRGFDREEIKQIFYGNVKKFLSEWRQRKKLGL